MKVVFLDVDGVLNSDFWNDSHQREISEGILIEEDKVGILASLIKKTNAKIIIHSGWRFWFNDELKPLRQESMQLVSLFEKEGLSIDGMTPDLTTEEIRRTKKFSVVKANEILLWLQLHENVTAWVVIDDLDLHNLQIESHQVKTNQMLGLTYEDVKRAERILGQYE